jgi:hypothetical protein
VRTAGTLRRPPADPPRCAAAGGGLQSVVVLRRSLIALVLAFALALTLPQAAGADSPAALRIDGPGPGAHAGTSVAGAGDVTGEGRPAVMVGPPLGTSGWPACAGTADVLFGPFAPGAADLAHPPEGLKITGARCRELTGMSVAAAGDVNGDGLDDVVIGAPAASPDDEGVATQRGRAYVVFGRRTGGTVDLTRLGDGGFAIEGRRRFVPDAFGWDVAGAGDVDGDGRDDVIIAAPGNPGFETRSTAGAAYVVLGSGSARTVEIAHLGRRGFRIGQTRPGGLRSVAGAGDVNRDGRDDVIAGDIEGAHGRGAAYVVLGRRHPRRVRLDRLRGRGFTISGRDRGAETGYDVAGGGDFNGDRRPDVLVTAPQGNRSGSAAAGGAFVVLGRRRQRDVDLRALGRHGVEIRGAARDWAGFAGAWAGRVNGDRRDDVVLTAHGSLAVVLGRRGHRPVRLAALAPADGFVIDGTIEPNQWYTDRSSGGLITAGAVGGDADGDGRDDVLAGDQVADHRARPDSGSAYLFFTPPFG